MKSDNRSGLDIIKFLADEYNKKYDKHFERDITVAELTAIIRKDNLLLVDFKGRTELELKMRQYEKKVIRSIEEEIIRDHGVERDSDKYFELLNNSTNKKRFNRIKDYANENIRIIQDIVGALCDGRDRENEDENIQQLTAIWSQQNAQEVKKIEHPLTKAVKHWVDYQMIDPITEHDDKTKPAGIIHHVMGSIWEVGPDYSRGLSLVLSLIHI